MKRTTILLEENLLLEVQQLAKEEQVTVSQVIQQAVADYVESQRWSRSHPPATEEEASPFELSAPLAEPIQSAEARSEPAPVEHQSISTENSGVKVKPFPWTALIFSVLGGLSALFALFQLILTIGEFTGGVRPLEVTFNHLLPGLLLTLIAVSLLFVASQTWRSRAT